MFSLEAAFVGILLLGIGMLWHFKYSDDRNRIIEARVARIENDLISLIRRLTEALKRNKEDA